MAFYMGPLILLSGRNEIRKFRTMRIYVGIEKCHLGLVKLVSTLLSPSGNLDCQARVDKVSPNLSGLSRSLHVTYVQLDPPIPWTISRFSHNVSNPINPSVPIFSPIHLGNTLRDEGSMGLSGNVFHAPAVHGLLPPANDHGRTLPRRGEVPHQPALHHQSDAGE